MAEQINNFQTTLDPEETLSRAVQFFSGEKFKVSSQSPRTATFEGKPPLPWGLMILTVLGLVACIIPGVVLYAMLVRKAYRFHNLVVAVEPSDAGTNVTVTHPDWAEELVSRFADALPAPENA